MMRAWFLPAVLAASTLGAAPSTTEPLALVGEATLSFHFGARASSGLPASMKVLLLLEKDGTGVAAVREPAAMARVKWVGDGEDLSVEPASLRFGPSSELRWTEWRIHFDAGTRDRGKGFAKGSLQLTTGDVVSAGEFEAALDLNPDRTPPSAVLVPTWSMGGEPVLPGEPLAVRFSEPIRVSAALASLSLLANSTPVAVNAEAVGAVQDLTLEARLTPKEPLPLAVTVALKLDQLTDVAGNVVSSTGPPLHTITEAAGFNGNPDFENGLTGWITNGGVTAEGAVLGRPPLEGKKQAVLKTPARLVGVADIPKNAKSLGFYAGAVSEGGGFEPGRSAVVWLVSGSERTAVFDAGAIAAQAAAVEPRRYLVDVAAYRGRRVYIVAETRGSDTFGMNAHTLIVDGFTVR